MPKKKEKRYCRLCLRKGVLTEVKDARKKCRVCKRIPEFSWNGPITESDLEEAAMDAIENIRAAEMEGIAEEIEACEYDISEYENHIAGCREEIEMLRSKREKELNKISNLEKLLYKLTGDEGWISPSPQP